MKKTTALILATLMLFAFLGGCASNQPAATQATQVQTIAETQTTATTVQTTHAAQKKAYKLKISTAATATQVHTLALKEFKKIWRKVRTK